MTTIKLKGQFVYLEPLHENYRETLRGMAKDERIWEFTKTLLINETYDVQFDEYFDVALGFVKSGWQAYVIRVVPEGRIIGMTRLFHVEQKDKRLEIGHTWYLPEFWGQVHNKECKLLLLQYVFETL